MTRVAYLDCFSGISGDMLLGALVHAGVSIDGLRSQLSLLGIEGWSIRAEAVRRSGIASTRTHVELADAPQPHRRLPEILAVIERSALKPDDRERAAKIFGLLADAEARVHGVSRDQIEFHEVGALDAMIDIVGGVIGLRLLGVDRLYCSPLPAGGGTARSAHGALPVPAPATLELMAMAGAPIAASTGDRAMELVTPTGAAIVTALATFERPSMHIEAVGYGAGGKDPDGWPNIVRIWVGEALEPARPAMLLIETNIDNMSAELFGYVQERLFAAGAADVWFQSIQMKKNRPAVLVSVLCGAEREDAIANVLLRETSTLGVRVSTVSRHEAQRESFEFESSLGAAAVKVKRLPGEAPRVAPEYEACRTIAETRGMPLSEVYRIIEHEALQRLQ